MIPRAPAFNIAGILRGCGAWVWMEKILHHLARANIEHRGQGGRCLSPTPLGSCSRGGAGFVPSTVSGMLFWWDVLGEMQNLIFAAAAFCAHVFARVHQPSQERSFGGMSGTLIGRPLDA